MNPLGHITLKPECPICGAQAVKTLPNNVNFKNGLHTFILRTKQCTQCRGSWHTLEVPVVMTDTLSEFRYLARKFRQAKK